MLMVNVFTGSFIFASIIAIFLAITWLGCMFSTKNNPAYASLCAFAVCLPLFYRMGERVIFILENGGMEDKDGYGSPLAFIVGMFFEGIMLAPYLILAIMGAVLWRKMYTASRLTSDCD